MKRLISILLAILSCLSLLAMLASCAHEHEASSAMEYDETHHWTVCAASGCGEEMERAEHVFTFEKGDNERHKKVCECGKEIWLKHNFDEGVVQKEPSKAEAGETVYTCADCGFVKTSYVQYKPETTINAGDFNNLINLVGVTNYTLTIDGDYELAHDIEGVYQYKDGAIKEDSWYWSLENGTKYQYYKKNNAYYVKVSDADTENDPMQNVRTSTRYDWRANLVKNLVYYFSVTSFNYNEETKYYETVNEKAILFCDIAGDEGTYVETYDKIKLYFEDGKLSKIYFERGDYSMYASITYGTADFTLPEVQ